MTNRVDWLGTVRARLGFLVTPNLLAYGTGGLAYGKVEGSTNIAQSDSGITGINGVNGVLPGERPLVLARSPKPARAGQLAVASSGCSYPTGP